MQQEQGPFANSAITSAYDELGRLASRTVQGAGAETFQYDAIGRLAGHGSDLGAFTLSYLGQTGQITSRQLASSILATTWSYLGNARKKGQALEATSTINPNIDPSIKFEPLPRFISGN